ncbi:MAG: hypothetical protein M1830_010063 [Pleopsidium flavum]|nr:MAG: hypothetical protein M1830_010063 [Pleopsidium flavum]
MYRRKIAQASAEHSLLTQRKDRQAGVEAALLDVSMLTTVLCNISKLRALSLEAAIYQDTVDRFATDGSHWLQSWNMASQTYLVALTAIAQSCLAVEQIDVYGGTWRCSVPTYEINEYMPQLKAVGLKEALASLRVLSLSMSTRICESNEDADEDAVRRVATDERNYLGPAQLLSLAPGLEELDLHLYRLLRSSTDYEAVFTHISTTVPLPKLLKCKLRGLDIRKRSLRQFLRNCPRLKAGELREIRLKEGIWRPVFDQCSSWASSTLESLTLHRVFEHHLLEFNGPARGSSGIHSVMIDKDQIRQGLYYSIKTQRLKGSPAL